MTGQVNTIEWLRLKHHSCGSVVEFMPHNPEDMGSNLFIVLYIRTVKCPFPMSKITDSAKNGCLAVNLVSKKAHN